MTRLLRPAALGLATLLAGCAAYTPRLAADAKPAAADAFVYGRFRIETPKAFLGLDGHASMGLGLKCSDGKDYLIRFFIDKPVHVIKVSPATCSVTETVYSNADGQVMGRKPFGGTALQGMEFKPGVAHYLGDFFATSDTHASGYNRVLSSWRLREVKNDYDATTSEMRAQYPGLAGTATADLAH
ncbi:MAG: hypothetical protein U1F53_02050 [Burkholderiaceae bacterium]